MPENPTSLFNPWVLPTWWGNMGSDENNIDGENFSAPQWPTQLYDINGNPTTMLPAGAPVPAGSYTSLGDAYAARYQAGQNPMLNPGAGGTPQNIGPILNTGGPGVIGGSLDVVDQSKLNPVFTTLGGPTVGIPTPGNPTGAGQSGGGLFGTSIDIGFPAGGPTIANVLSGAAGLGLGAALGSGGSGGRTDNPTTIIPPIISSGSSNSVPIGTPAWPVLTSTAHGTTGTTLGSTDNPTTTLPIIPPLIRSGGGTTPIIPFTPTGPTATPTTPTTPTVPTSNILDRDYLREGTATNAANAQLGQGIFSNYANFSGQYGAQDQQNFAALLQQLGLSNNSLTGIANQQTGAANSALRGGNTNDAALFGPQQLATLQGLNPNQYAALNATNVGASAGIGANQFQNGLGGQFAAGGGNPLLQFANSQAQGAGYSPLGQDLQTMAREQLALGSGLSDEQKRNATQAAREAWSARGLINSNGAVGAEVLNRDAYGQQLLNQRQQFAAGVNQLGMGQQGINNSFLLGTQGANQSATNQNQNLGLNLAQMDYGRQQQGFQNLFNNAQLQTAAAFNPFAGMNNNTTNTGSNSSLFGENAGFSSGALGNQYVAGMTSPFNPYAQDVFGSNFNAANARSIAAGNNAAARAGAQDAASGALANNFLNLLGSLYG
jgi:hypothetical protein